VFSLTININHRKQHLQELIISHKNLVLQVITEVLIIRVLHQDIEEVLDLVGIVRVIFIEDYEIF
jgi:hypothetical protein